LELKREQEALAVHEREDDALSAILADWNAARSAHGLPQAVMIARDNGTRALLNDRARQLLVREGAIAADGVAIADREFAVGDRVIARRNDRHRDVDNGTLGRVAEIDCRTGALTVITDSGDHRLLDAAYVAEHLEHAYALTGHGAHGATVEWAGVTGRPAEFTREWAYTSLSRARGRTRVYVIAEPTAKQRQREEYAQPEPERTTAGAVDVLRRTMRRREAEPLALEHIVPGYISERIDSPAQVPLAELAEAGPERACRAVSSPHQRDLRTVSQAREREHSGGLER
jgi:hypothetical protein